MTVTTTGLTRAAGVSRRRRRERSSSASRSTTPPWTLSSVDTTEWAVRNTAKVVMAALALAGITGMYLRQVRQTGVLGLIGYLVFSAGYLVMLSVAFVAAYVLPSLVDIEPGYVDDVLTAAAGGTPAGDIGSHAGRLPRLRRSGTSAGGLLFGIALFRAGILARWAAALLAVGTTATLALAVLPDSFNRPFAVPTGVALIGLGVSLWRDQQDTRPEPTPAEARVEQPAVR